MGDVLGEAGGSGTRVAGLTLLPCIIVVFEQVWGREPDGSKRNGVTSASASQIAMHVQS
jgi:hypothetical protein